MPDSVSMSEKLCTKCNEVFPATTEFFYTNKRHKDGLKSQCKKCCKNYYWANRQDKLEYQKQYQQENTEYYMQYQQQYRKENRETLKEKKQESYRNNILHYRQYHRKNKKKKQKYDRSRRAKRAAYQRENRIKCRVHKHNHRARKCKLPSNFTDKQWQLALDYFNGCCAVCGRQLKDLFGTHTVAADHWIPLSHNSKDNPGTVATNIVPLCHGQDGCNNLKHDKLPYEWLIERYGTRKAKQIMRRIQNYFTWIANQEEKPCDQLD